MADDLGDTKNNKQEKTLSPQENYSQIKFPVYGALWYQAHVTFSAGLGCVFKPDSAVLSGIKILEPI